ncbi:MAG: MMPL family transporter [Solirubrobacterales bacterium]|nr:MMPL family transporter [Solirubrobacterales bacterium]MBV9714177.1 MMPL family transporter [Solirubrobacterales bacterium]
MKVLARLERIVAVSLRRPAVVLAVIVALAVAGAVLSLHLAPSAASSTFVSSSSASYRATADDQRHFGADPVVILIRESLPNLVETKDLATVSQLEACLAGQTLVASQSLGSFTPASATAAQPYGGRSSPCGHLMRAKPVQVVYGPGTFLNRAVAAVNTEVQAMMSSARQAVQTAGADAYRLGLGRGLPRGQAIAAGNAAAALEQQQQLENLAQTYLESGITGTPRIDDPQFIPQIVFDQTRGVNQPKARFAYLFPTAESALIQVRLKSSLTSAQQAQAINWIRQAVRMPMFRSAYGGRYTVTGEPVVVNDLASELSGSVAGLVVAALAVMACALLLVFRSRLRLLPLALAMATAAITFGILAGLRGSLTMASLAVLPILIGLSVDYAIQFQSRVQEARAESIGTREAVTRGARAGAPAIATAAAATATGFLALLLSPVPMVRGFGLLLVLGIAVAVLCTLTAGSAALVIGERDGGVVGASLRGAGEILAEAARRADATRRRRLAARRPRRVATTRLRRVATTRRRRFAATRRRGGMGMRVLHRSLASPGRVIALGALLAGLGWLADTQTSVQSDVTRLVPASMPALRDLRTLENATRVSGEIDVTVRAGDVATPKTIAWMIAYEQKLLRHYGYVETKGCTAATLCPALSLPDLFSAGSPSAQGASPSLGQSSIEALLRAVPSYFSQAVITPDRREASLAFGIRLMPLGRQQRVVDYMRSQLHPPSGVQAQLAGLPVLAAQANAVLASSGRRLLTQLVALLAVAAVLLALLRSRRRAIVPLVPIVLATGWSALIVFLIGIPLNPMSASLGSLVIAISTEFSVLLSERFGQERAAGYELREALARTYRHTGTPVLASGLTAIAGFGVLVVSNVTMLRDFGFVTLVDLAVSLAGVLFLLPAVLALAEHGDVAERARQRMRRAGGAMRPRRRRARVA